MLRNHNVDPRTGPGAELGIEALERFATEPERRYERLIEHSQDVIFRLRLYPDVGFDYINPAVERVFGFPLAEFRAAGRDFIMSLLADDEERADAEEVLAGRTFHAVRLRRWRRADGSEIWTEVRNYPVYDETGRLIAQEGVLRDVTERELAVRALQEIQRHQAELVDFLPDLVMRVDESGVFSEHMHTGSKQPANLFLGRAIDTVIDAEEVSIARQALKRALVGKPQVFRAKVDIVGEERLYDFRLFPTGSGELLAFMRDVTGENWTVGEAERRRSRDELERKVERQYGIRNPYEFTFREFTVLHLVARGAADKEIASELGIALSTVNKHVSNILGKMNAVSRTEAGVRAVQEGLASV
jgi:PAS domain S-box-containing protein